MRGSGKPLLPIYTSDLSVLSASVTMAWRLRRTSRSVRTGRFSSSRTSNQSSRKRSYKQFLGGPKRKGTNKIGPVEGQRYVSILGELPFCSHAE